MINPSKGRDRVYSNQCECLRIIHLCIYSQIFSSCNCSHSGRFSLKCCWKTVFSPMIARRLCSPLLCRKFSTSLHTAMPLNLKSVYPAENPEFSFASRRSTVHSTQGIVSCTQPLAARCGIKILDAGGNATVS